VRVGFIGVGDQGGAMARAVVENGYSLTLWARRPESLEQYSDTSAEIAPTIDALAAESDLVEVCVVDDAGVEEVVGRLLQGMQPGTIIAIHSTIHPDTCVTLADRASEKGITLIDAPVSGGGEAASKRELLVMVGGDENAVERCLPVFSTFGNPVRYLGPLGSGQRAKLINNALMCAHLGLAHDAMELGEQIGIDQAALAEVLQHGSGRSYSLTAYARTLSMAKMGPQVRPLLRKDVSVLSRLLESSHADAGQLVVAAEHSLMLMEEESATD
jgi:3-hydroxyisobutyrate dehydrogenase